jgi:hypothetical protein
MSLSVNPDEDSVSVAPRPLKRSYAFHGGLSKNWRENMTYSKQLRSILNHATHGNVFPKALGDAKALESPPVWLIAPIMAVASVRGRQIQCQASLMVMRPSKP